MSTRPPDHDPTTRAPLDAEEQAFARVLRALPSAEPPAALDAKILRAATDAVAAGPRRRRLSWLGTGGAGWGIGSAAAAVLALGIGWQAYYGDARRHEPVPVPMSRTAEADDADAPVMVDFKDQSTLAEQAAASPPAPPPAEAPAASPRPPVPARTRATAAPAVTPAPEAFPDAGLDQQAADAYAAEATAEAAAADASEGYARRAEARQEQAAKAAAGNAIGAAAAPDVALQAGAERGVAAASDAAATAPAREQALVPATWLDEVRKLRDQGRTADARARLLAFRRAYPHWNIPSDLAPLLRE